MSDYWKHQLSKVIDYFTRQKKPSFVLMATGLALLAGQKVINFAITGTFSWGTLSVGTAESNVVTDYIIPALGVTLIIVGMVLIAINEALALRQNTKKRIILITGDGLRTTVGTGIETTAKAILKGTIHPSGINITQQIRDGVVIEPERVFTRQIQPVKENLSQLFANTTPGTTQVAYGGFLPVPFTFFLGNVLDDKGDVNVFDWDRGNECWKHISDNNPDDGESFISETVRSSTSDQTVLVLSCSYRIDISQVERSFAETGIEHLMLPTNTFNNHWSLAKQRRLSMQFAETIKSLSSQGIKRIHLILAAQSSVVLNLARRYDSRNMPELIVYQYEQSTDNPYPWGIYALSHGHEDGGFVWHMQNGV
ncbi:SAVED domain-containing protein [Enterobacter ludwigii]|uniref:SAVED domain-containing protein n=1 Tax=Enterobacter ludwigii TaxID=299767 RepID=UPI002FD565E0